MARLLAAVFLATMLTATLAAPMSEALLALLQAEPTPGAPVIRPQPSPGDPPVLVLDDDGDRRRMLNFYLQRALIQNEDTPPPLIFPTPPRLVGRTAMANIIANHPGSVVRPAPVPIIYVPPLSQDDNGLLHLYLQQAMAQDKRQGGQTARAQFDWGKLAGSALQTAADYYGRK